MGFVDDAKSAWRWVGRHDWKRTLRTCVKRKYWGWWFLALVVAVAASLLSIYQDNIVHWIEPYKLEINKESWSWIIAFLLIVVWSIPPMVGQPVLAISIGLIWGFTVGAAIIVPATIVGESLVFVVVRWKFTGFARRLESRNILYACVAQLLRQSGFWMNLVLRLSFLSGHIVTILQAVTDVPYWIFVAVQLPESPKSLSLVYIGVVFGEAASTSQLLISLAIYAVNLLLSVVAAIIVTRHIKRVYPSVKAEMDERKPYEGEVSSSDWSQGSTTEDEDESDGSSEMTSSDDDISGSDDRHLRLERTGVGGPRRASQDRRERSGAARRGTGSKATS